MMCYRCGQEGHFARDCQSTEPPGGGPPGRPAGGRGRGRGGNPVVCYKCNQEGHFARDCVNGAAAGGGGRSAADTVRDKLRGEGVDGQWGGDGDGAKPAPPLPEPEPDFGLSGALAAETNTENGVTLVYTEPPEKQLPRQRWRLYTFKGNDTVGEPLNVGMLTCYLFGRERRVATVPTDHPSCSKQHAVLQWRLTSKLDDIGLPKPGVRPYIMDLGSTNGTFLNGEQVEAQKYYELLHQDTLRFGHSTREYVLLCEDAAKGAAQ